MQNFLFNDSRIQAVKNHLPQIMMFSLFLGLLLAPELAYASSSAGMPWENPLQKLVRSITGPIAFGVSVLAIVASGITLIWGGEIAGLIKTLIYIALVISLIVFATNILSSLFGVSSAIIL